MRFSKSFLSEGLKKREAAGPPTRVPSKKPKRAKRASSSPEVTLAGKRVGRRDPSVEEIVTEVPPATSQEEPPMGVPLPQARRESTEEGFPPSVETEDGATQEGRVASPPIQETGEDHVSGDRSPREEVEVPPEEGLTNRPSGINAMRRGRLAERILSRSVLPNLQAELRRQPLEKSLDAFFTAFLQASNSAFILRDVCLGNSGDPKQSSSELQALKSRVSILTMEVSEAKAREQVALDALKVAEAENQSLKVQIGEAGQKIREVEIKLAESVSSMGLAEEKLKDALLRATQAEERAVAAEDRVELLDFEARALEERLANAEERLDLAKEKLASTEEKLASAQEETQQTLTKLLFLEVQAEKKITAVQAEAMVRVSAANKRAENAVEAYKGSAEFAAECSEAAIDAYAKGFRKCKKKILRLYPLSGLENIQPVDEDAESESSSSEA